MNDAAINIDESSGGSGGVNAIRCHHGYMTMTTTSLDWNPGLVALVKERGFTSVCQFARAQGLDYVGIHKAFCSRIRNITPGLVKNIAGALGIDAHTVANRVGFDPLA
jgi:hypothetical protein